MVGVLRDAFGGFAVLRRERPLLLTLVQSASIVVLGALDVLLVAVAIDLLHEGQAWPGFLYSAFGLGGIAGAFGIRAVLVVTGTFVPAVVLLGRPPLLAIDRTAKAPDAVALTLLRRLPIFAPLCRRVALSRGGSGPVAEFSRSDRGARASCVDTATARLPDMSFATAR